MTRTIVCFEPLGPDTIMKLETAPTAIPGLGDNARVTLVSPSGSILDRGKDLHRQLTAHPPIRAGLNAALGLLATSDPSPLYFHVLAACADALPWEQLCDDVHGFYALDHRWPIGRIAKTVVDVKPRVFEPPLRIVAVLSAASNRSGLPQLKALLKAVSSPDAAEIGVHLHVISAEPAVTKAVAAAGMSNVTSEVLPGTGPRLARSIARARPHILHLLCHGDAAVAVRSLVFATMPDFMAGHETGSVRLSAPDLIQALKSCDPWLVVLSACETAEATDSPSLAHDLVCEGIPAVAGMRRLVDLGATNDFCEELYPAVLTTVRRVTDGAKSSDVHVDWAECFTAPRKAMGGIDPCANDAWSDPVLYAQFQPLVVFRGSSKLTGEEYSFVIAQLKIWERYRDTLDPATTPWRVLDDIDSNITKLRARLAEGGVDEPTY